MLSEVALYDGLYTISVAKTAMMYMYYAATK